MFCPHCDGSIYKARIVPLNLEVYLCDTCESLWEAKNVRNVINPSMNSLEPYLKQYELDYMTTEIQNLGYDWDKSVLQNKNIILCPFCKNKGIVYHVKIGALGIYAYYCDNCNALWHDNNKIDINSVETMLGLLQSKGLDYSTAQLSDFTIDWAKEKNDL